MYHFVCAFGIEVKSTDINKSSNKRYWTFEKSERLDKVIELYNKIKHSI